VDTYLVQRLRRIRQLGVIHWVFPSTTHTRFEHSLGVVRQMQALLEGVERNSARAGEPVIDDSFVYLLRMAALLHDVGHTVMSHVSEQLLDDLPEVDDLISWTEERYRTRKTPSASEAIAAVFINSPAFRNFLQIRQVGADFIGDVTEATTIMAGLILGSPVRPNIEFLSLLLNGAFDADKLDYMPRDCQMAGVPGAVDVERVVEKVQVLCVPTALLPSEYRTWIGTEIPERTNVLCLSAAGAGALHELATTRTILFQKVYHHQKVRALEVMARRTLRRMTKRGQLASITQWMNITDDDLLSEEDLSGALRERNLLKRAFRLVEPTNDTDVVEVAKGKFLSVGEGWQRVRDDVVSDELQQRIVDEALKVSAALGLSLEDEIREIEVDLPDLTKYSLDQFAFVGDGVDDFRLEGAVIAGERSENTKRLSLAHGHVFAPELAVIATFIAARIVLHRDYAQMSGPGAHTVTKLDLDELLAAERKLDERNYFGQVIDFKRTRQARIRSHRELAVETFLKSAWSRVQRVAADFGRYQAPGSNRISANEVAAFLRQFQREELARPALRLLESIRLKDRFYFAQQLQTVVREAEKRAPVRVISPLGATGDSSTLLSYLMNDLPRDLRRDVLPLELALEAETSGDSQILLWDDFCGQGSHALTAFYQWLGIGNTPLQETLVTKLSEERLKLFRDRRIGVAFAAGLRDGIKSIRDFAERELPNLTIFDPAELIPDADSVFATKSVLHDDTEREALRQFLTAKGEELLRAEMTREQDPWDEKKVKDRALGYGNAAHRIVFYYNVPTVTITALWRATDDVDWKPLFARRGKVRTTASS